MMRLCSLAIAVGSLAVSTVTAAATRLAPVAAEIGLDAMRARIDAARARIDAQTRLYHDPVGPRTWIDGARFWFCETDRGGARRW